MSSLTFKMTLKGFNRKLRTLDIGRRMRSRLSDKGEEALLDIMEEGANDIRNTAIKSMDNSPPTGRLYSGGGRSAPHRASSPGNPPRKDSTNLANSILVDAGPMSIEVGSIITDPPYPKWLEEGTDKMEARPWLEPALKTHEDTIRANAESALNNIIRNFGKGA